MTDLLTYTDPSRDREAIVRGARLLREGKLVAFPTETVYGLGACALDADAVARIFEAKGRPSTNPLIVHVASIEAAKQLTASWSSSAEQLARTFWPGPLTLVLPKTAAIPDIVTAGGPTIGLRIPAHPAALSLLAEAQIPIAAPSANRSMNVSPTRADHVMAELAGRIDLVIDGGPTDVGIESTVLDLTEPQPRILRPGMVTQPMLERIVGPVSLGSPHAAIAARPARSPGQMSRHYAPRALVEIHSPSAAWARLAELSHSGVPAGWLGRTADFEESSLAKSADAACLSNDAAGFANQLFAELRRLDGLGLERIIVARPPDGPEWQGIHDRLQRGTVGE